MILLGIDVLGEMLCLSSAGCIIKQQQAVFFRLRDQDRVRRLLSVTYIAKTNVHSLGLNT